MKYFGIFYLSLGIWLLGPVVESQAQNPALTNVAAALEADPDNPILLMQRQMLAHKAGDIQSGRMPNRRWPLRRTNLRLELTGPMPVAASQQTYGESLELLTGQRAIDESLQLGSVGSDPTGDERTGSLSIDEMQPVEIASHPWEEMIAGREVAVPEIASVVPRDMLFVHMSKPRQFLELENILKEQAALFGDVYHLGRAVGLKSKMMKRLGIPDADELIAGVEEMAFVSEDLAFYPRTDYALIVKPKNVLAEKGFELLVGDDAIIDKVGAYLIIATHADVIGRTRSAAAGETGRMADEKDYHYTLLEMEPRRDGLIYLSEAFIRKLTGPAYRINSRRRNTVLDALETLQYSVFAYRRISGQWPDSLQAMVDEGYISAGSIYAPQNYTIDELGRLSHNTWGHIWQATPVNQVPISTITGDEATNYQRFSAGYQSFFREFFDPIGIAYTISDQLYLHTLIMPLINNSDYRELQSFLSSTPGQFTFLFEPDRLGAINIAAGFSLDDILMRMARQSRRNGEDVELTESARAQMIYEAEKELARDIFDEELAPGDRLLDFIGDEVFFGVGEKNAFHLSNIADIDVWFGVRLRDRARAEAFFRKLWLRIAQDFGGRGSGLFQLSTTEPLSNEYNGQKYYLLPTGFVNVFYAFFEDVFYVTISQVAMNRLIDARENHASAEFSDNLMRGLAHIGVEHNMVAALDLGKIAAFELGEELNMAGRRMVEQLRIHSNTLNEAMTLAKALPGYDGTLASVDQYYRDLPVRFYTASFDAEAGQLYLVTTDGRHELGDLSRQRANQRSALLASSLSAADVRDRLGAFRSAALGLSFIPEGLDVKLSIGNPNVTTPDARFAFDTPAGQDRDAMDYKRVISVIVIVLLVIIMLAALMRGPRQNPQA